MPTPGPRILLAVTGMSPQIVTETLYALAVAGDPPWPPDEIHLISTAQGAAQARLNLLSDTPGWFQRLCRDYGLPDIRFTADHIHVLTDPQGHPLDDIRTPQDNEAAADFITERVRELTRDPASTLHASIAGGRKTMGFFLGYAMSLYGRPQDRLSHVLISAPFEGHPDFYYPTPRQQPGCVPLRPQQGRRRTGRGPLALAQETGQTGAEAIPALRERTDWNQSKFLLVQGDFTGIQDFIFAEGGETQRQAAKLLRGRSFQVALLSELAALAVLEALDLPPTSQIVNAAGKCLIVAPNTDHTRARLEEVQARLNAWFLEHTFGESAYVLAWEPAACDDFLQGRFAGLMKRLFESLETAKLQRFDLTRQPQEAAIRGADFHLKECAFDGRRPAQTTVADKRASLLAADQIALGRWLADKRMSRLLVARASAELRESGNVKPLGLDYFGYRVAFASDQEASGRFGPLAESGELLRCWDFSLPGEDDSAALFQGYARRDINAYVPVFDPAKVEWEASKYGKWQEEVDLDREVPVKTLNHLACEDKLPKGDDLEHWQGVTALAVLKGDVDNLGSLFQRGIQPPTFAKMAALSRQMNAFFAVHLPWLCQSKPEFRDTYPTNGHLEKPPHPAHR